MPTPTKQPVPFTFQDPAGNPLAGGSVVARLSMDIAIAASSGPQVSAGRAVTGTLNNGGSCTLLLWPNDVLLPSGTIYFVTAYSAKGQPVWKGQIEVTIPAENDLLMETSDPFLLETGSPNRILLEI